MVKRKRLTADEKFLASAVHPTSNGATRREVYQAERKARGRFWDDPDSGWFVCFSPDGRAKRLPYGLGWKDDVRKCARMWAQGKTRPALDKYDEVFDDNLDL